MNYGAVIGWCVLSFALGWFLGRMFLRLWFHKELNILEAKVLANTSKMAANHETILELTKQMQATVQKAQDQVSK